MLNDEYIYNVEKYKLQIQKYALCCDDFRDGVYRAPKDKALLKKYICFNNKSFINGLVFDVDHKYGAVAWDLVGLPIPNTIIQNIKNGHAHLLYALKNPVLKTDMARDKPLKLAAIVQSGFTERLDADRAYADVLMKNPLNMHEWRTTWTNTSAYDLQYLLDFIPDKIRISSKKKSVIHGLGRNVNLFEDLRIIAYKEVLTFKKSKNYHCFFYDMLSKATLLNNHSNPHNPLSHEETKQICSSICKWTWRNFSIQKFSTIQSIRAKKTRKTQKKLEIALETLL
ncbi:replication initiation protein [Klebsiella pneumoniae]|nr:MULTISPECIES: replication initiation protein [Klebsiella]EBP4343032.1 replication protein [Salmonella enterica]HBY0408302.1 replication protein [Klebsiella pneumoniae subsp. pneumoniae]MBZ1708113.1 replication initiation protein [Klebsiella pneumoniae]SXF62611.1 plasmid replication protein [Klebsiella variicola]HBT8380133.1 replication protein [Klebsiella pneumoniae]